MLRFLLIALSSLFIFQCSKNPAPEKEELQEQVEKIFILDEIPEHIQDVENLTIYPGDSEPLYEIELITIIIRS